MSKTTIVSVSSISSYLSCPRAYKYARVDKLEKHTDYPRLTGIQVHRFIQMLHKPPKEKRRYYYTDIKSARGAWKGAWLKALEENRPLMIEPLPKSKEWMWWGIGWKCIKNYWEVIEHRPNPLYIEKKLEMPISTGVSLVGKPDQIRELSIESIKTLRPDLIVSGKLISGYDPVLIVDFKTGFQNLSLEKNGEKPTQLAKKRNQFAFHEQYQPTAYTMLYEYVFDALPIGFLQWGLRTNKSYFTIRTEENFQDFREVIQHVVDNVQARSFPKIPDRYKCRNCDFFEACRGSLPFYLSGKKNTPGKRLFTEIDNPLKPVDPQLSLGMKVERRKVKKTKQTADEKVKKTTKEIGSDE